MAAGDVKVGDWVSVSKGLGPVVDVRHLHYEEWERIPDGSALGDYNRTSVTVKAAFDHNGKPKSRLDWEATVLFSPLNAKQWKKVNAAIAKAPGLAEKIELYEIQNWASLVNLACEATDEQWRRIHDALERNESRIEAGVTFADVKTLLARDAGYELRLSETPTHCRLQLTVCLDSPPGPPRVFQMARVLGLPNP